jgi:uncharacterized protein (TIGR03435 family)
MQRFYRFVFACGAFALCAGSFTPASLGARSAADQDTVILQGGAPAPGTAVTSGAPTPTTFEVASVKANKSGDPGIRFGLQPGGRFNAVNAPLRELIRFAYNVQPFQIEGGPGWIGSERFDVTAKGEGNIGPTAPGQVGPIQVMMQSLLADRFKLRVKRESKDVPIYTLVMARSDSRLGPKIEASTVDCAALMKARMGGPGGPGRGAAPPAPPRPGEKPECGMFMGPASVGAGSVTMDQFAQLLATRVNRPVLNKTGLVGNYSFTLDFTPDQIPAGGFQLNGAPLPINPDGPSIFTALQEQLGLKLDSQRGPVEMLVIDSVEQPTPD